MLLSHKISFLTPAGNIFWRPPRQSCAKSSRQLRSLLLVVQTLLLFVGDQGKGYLQLLQTPSLKVPKVKRTTSAALIEFIHMFIDLNIVYSDDNQKHRQAIIQRICQLGYDGFAFNHIVRGKPSRDKFRTIEEVKSPAGDIENLVLETQDYKGRGRSLKQWTRITFVINEQVDVSDYIMHVLNASNPILRSYDIIAVQPATEKLLQQCLQFDIDIVTMDLNEKLPFHLKRPQVHVMNSRNIKFELCYSNLLQPSTVRQRVIANACSLVKTLKSELIVLSSGALDPMSLRSPYDIMHMALFLGMNEHQARSAIAENPMDVINASSQRLYTFKDALHVLRPSESPSAMWQFKTLDNTDNGNGSCSSAKNQPRKRTREAAGHMESTSEPENSNAPKRSKELETWQGNLVT
eukprot:jgi/Galph1/3314/GphlegSOOS_G1975.1